MHIKISGAYENICPWDLFHIYAAGAVSGRVGRIVFQSIPSQDEGGRAMPRAWRRREVRRQDQDTRTAGEQKRSHGDPRGTGISSRDAAIPRSELASLSKATSRGEEGKDAWLQSTSTLVILQPSKETPPHGDSYHGFMEDKWSVKTVCHTPAKKPRWDRNSVSVTKTVPLAGDTDERDYATERPGALSPA